MKHADFIEPLLDMDEMCQRLGCGRQTIARAVKDDPTCPARKVRGRFKSDRQKFEDWIGGLRQSRHESFRATVAGTGGVHSLPPELAIADAAEDIRYILHRGIAPEGRNWQNASHLSGDVPPDICAGFGVSANASWGLVVSRAEKLLTLPSGQKVISHTFIAKRLKEYFDSTRDALADDEALS